MRWYCRICAQDGGEGPAAGGGPDPDPIAGQPLGFFRRALYSLTAPPPPCRVRGRVRAPPKLIHHLLADNGPLRKDWDPTFISGADISQYISEQSELDLHSVVRSKSPPWRHAAGPVADSSVRPCVRAGQEVEPDASDDIGGHSQLVHLLLRPLNVWGINCSRPRDAVLLQHWRLEEGTYLMTFTSMPKYDSKVPVAPGAVRFSTGGFIEIRPVRIDTPRMRSPFSHPKALRPSPDHAALPAWRARVRADGRRRVRVARHDGPREDPVQRAPAPPPPAPLPAPCTHTPRAAPGGELGVCF